MYNKPRKEHLWYLHGKWYDLSAFARQHPGGRQMIELGQGTDCTPLFSCYHDKFPVERLRPYEVPAPDNAASNTGLFSYKANGFFRQVRKRVYRQIKERHLPIKSNATDWIILAIHLLATGITFKLGMLQGSIGWAVVFGILRGLIYVRPLHAASHYEMAEQPWINRSLSVVCASLSGSIPSHWAAQHVRDHHCFPNIESVDKDSLYPIKNIYPHQPKYRWNRLQHFYVPVLFSFASINYFLSDLIRIAIDAVRRPTTSRLLERGTIISIQATLKALPFLFLGWKEALGLTLLAEILTSIYVIAQTVVNHELPETTQHQHQLQPGEDWGAWQMCTSHNWRTGSRWANALSGGLSHQIEHHLFPEVHYRHYPWIAEIVREEAKEFKLPYYESPSLTYALKRHYTHLVSIAHS